MAGVTNSLDRNSHLLGGNSHSVPRLHSKLKKHSSIQLDRVLVSDLYGTATRYSLEMTQEKKRSLEMKWDLDHG